MSGRRNRPDYGRLLWLFNPQTELPPLPWARQPLFATVRNAGIAADRGSSAYESGTPGKPHLRIINRVPGEKGNGTDFQLLQSHMAAPATWGFRPEGLLNDTYRIDCSMRGYEPTVPELELSIQRLSFFYL